MSCDHFMKLQAGMVFVVYCVLLFGAQPASTIVILSLITRPQPQEGEGPADYILFPCTVWCEPIVWLFIDT